MSVELNINYRWCAWNFEGTGKDKGGSLSTNHWYREDVRYYHETPVQRWVRTAKGNLILLVRRMGPACDHQNVFHKNKNGYMREGGYLDRHPRVHVEDLGVFSMFAGDKLDGNDLHDRMRYIMINRVRYFVYEVVPNITGDALLLSGNSWSNHEGLEKQLVAWSDNYERYNRMFELGWDPIPIMYFRKFDTDVAKKKQAYLDPKAVKQRERNKAKTLAMNVLAPEA